MDKSKLEAGKKYRLTKEVDGNKKGTIAVFKAFDGSGNWAICHPKGSPDTQSHFVVEPETELEEV